MSLRSEPVYASCAAAAPPVAPAVPQPARLSGDHLITVRDAVAGVYQRNGMCALAARTLRGEMDQMPMMEAGLAAVAAVLRGMFDG